MKEYDHKKIEKKWQDTWEKKGIYHAQDKSKKPKYYALIEFPYPSGDGLHVGHPRPYIGMDVISRKRRLQGFNVLYPIGWDAFGLPTENYAIKTGKDPRVVTKKNSDTFRRQIKSLGISFDWSREVNTTDPKYYKWTQWIFLQFFKKGLAYKAKMKINWCPKDKIGLANEEVVDGKCERCGTVVEQREKEQWMLAITKYAERLDKDLDGVDYLPQIKLGQRNWIGRKEGAEIEFDNIKIFTTRPDTIFGVTFVAIAGDTDRFTGRYVTNPATKEKIPVWEAQYVMGDVGTGAIMGVPADDERDKAFAEKYKLPIIENYPKAGFEDYGKKVTRFKLRDWVFSRQRYWGEPIPVIHCESCGIVPVPEKDLPVELPKVKNYQPTDSGESPLANIAKWVNVKCPKCKGPAKRETDTMPNWAGSSWYYLRYADPKNNKEFASQKNLKYFTPVDWYNGGNEHTTLHLLYSRFWHKFLFDQGLVPTNEPYMKRTSHGMILGEGGVKMSKSLGNVINPDDIVKIYGADTLRLYEMFIGPFDQSAAWSTESIIGSRRFLERVWNLQYKVEKNKKYTEFKIEKTIKKVTEDIETMKFNTAISALMIFINDLGGVDSVSKDVYKKFLQILSPFAPHMTEELWTILGEKKSINLSAWPTFDENLIKDEEIKIVVQVNGKVRAFMSVQAGDSEEYIKAEVLKKADILKYIEGKNVKKIIYVPNRLINIVL
ncbi:leucine--tRNA ligase [Candidatus Nomurabacteria bacterium RIFCSPLOWO2_01_FULL_42_17]|uniref:Leucine--tRNA ligase n=1 Tax=Candidatus Nomurabacteria bacterium RIFCSPLOWO2_01_FULL_42_17 TaxID=1801780 RepID=A0A1F6XNZ0_9BACT|nr:MAG: leucine--tRNA ligase [Candidatus Nomurabacteria bacterium RIFCSPLOWO2_01_FULL_42_17]